MGISARVKECIKAKNVKIMAKRKEYEDIQDKLRQLKEARTKGYNNHQEINLMSGKATEVMMEIKSLAAEARREAEALCDEEMNRLSLLDMPRGEDITEDAALLNSGIRLTEQEVIALANKDINKNSTMSRLLLQYAEDHDMKTARAGIYSASKNSHSAEISSVDQIKSACPFYEKWLIDGRAEENIEDAL